MGVNDLEAGGAMAEQPTRVPKSIPDETRNNKTKTIFLGVVAVICILALAIALSVGLTQTNKNNNNNSSSRSNSISDNDNSTASGIEQDESTPAPSILTTMVETGSPSSTSTSTILAPTVSPSFTTTTKATTNDPTAFETTMAPSMALSEDISSSSICPGATESCMNENNYQTCRELEDTGCEVMILESCPLQFSCNQGSSSSSSTNTTTNTTTTVQNNNNTTITQNNSTIASASLLSQDTYTSVGRTFDVQLRSFGAGIVDGYNDEKDLRNDLTEIAKYICNSAIENNLYYMRNPMPIMSIAVESDFADSNADAGAGSSQSSPSAEGVTDFETNNQEDGVDEGDAVKSDGTHNFAAYGDVLVVWNALTGDLVLNLTMPEINYSVPEYNEEPSFHPDSGSGRGNITTDETMLNITATEEGATAQARSSFIGYWNPKPYIRSILLQNQKLVLIVEGYGEETRQQNLQEDITPAFYDTLNTRVMIYDTSDLPNQLTLLEQKDIQGSFRDVRAIGSDIHMVTTAGLNTYTLLSQHVDRWQPQFADLSEDEYKEAARTAAEKYIPQFVDIVIRDISLGGDIPELSQISLWQSVLSNETESIFSDSPINSYTQLTSFDVSTITSSDDNSATVTYSVAGTFTPSSWGYTYAVGDMLVFAMQGWGWVAELEGSGETTYLVGFTLDGASATPTAVGAFPGYLLNQYSLDIYEGHLRIATTIRSFWVGVLPEITPVDEEETNGDMDTDTLPVVWERRWGTKNQVLILEIPTIGGDSSSNVFTEVSRIPDLGKPGEVFTTVRFFDDRAYAVTFERTDPFYVLDLDAQNPSVLGELNITGFSSYLHSINEDNSLLLAIGQEADENGRILGLQITMFDATNATDPALLHRHVVEQKKDVWSSSSVEFDFKAFRYVSLGTTDGVGILILPLRVSSWQNVENGNFDGFRVYDVSKTDGIRERMEISHVEWDAFYGCYYDAYLPERSFVFDGDVTTMKGHSIVSTDLDSGVQEWKLEMPEPTNKDNCIYW
eukprot:CAMPEP_0202447998 /NCGR_PEP_ID=MMETSP1360-20130828/6779_1 /ASSEMBLY_ACC=CAM_ASM_000848 /TAXON_ID=515479 /ORGANISM="Licmophora paradoxa, Strain CCMP2313" /LENGTH=1014 /DNA_ID=CAMNT_0049065353 /DNA_START=74 /DNA_END=3118 /DNA_ORIENTATION=+